MKRKLLLILGWAGIIGSIADGLLALIALWYAAKATPFDYSLSVDTLLREHIAWLYWVKQLAYYFLPDGFVAWVFALPALILMPVRMVVSGLIGKWAFAAARRIEARPDSLQG